MQYANITGAGYGITSTAISAPSPRQPEVSNEMERLASECEAVDRQVHALEQRLESVLAQRKDTEAGLAQNAPEPVRVPLAQTLHDRVAQLSAISSRLQSIIERIEI